MTDLDLFEAWGLWLDNIQVNQHTLFGVSILALGRIGKVVSFVAGMTVILDLIGPERLQRFGRRTTSADVDTFRPWHMATMILVLPGAAVALFWYAVQDGYVTVSDTARTAVNMAFYGVVLVTLFLFPRVTNWVIRGMGRLLQNPELEPRVRWGSVVLLMVGFHFDLLAS